MVVLLQEVFPVQYGSQYDAALHVLLWEMLTKLEKMLPVPDLKQVFSVLPLPMRHSTTTYVHNNEGCDYRLRPGLAPPFLWRNALNPQPRN